MHFLLSRTASVTMWNVRPLYQLVARVWGQGPRAARAPRPRAVVSPVAPSEVRRMSNSCASASILSRPSCCKPARCRRSRSNRTGPRPAVPRPCKSRWCRDDGCGVPQRARILG
ncbi:unnamed protein product [Pelagomonas calceolata]|uniref:Uncharacterized protein n=1 Tax=Pelagomonas calceolata TaxID=35677 RepID=A0A8J2SEM0_9STRA|nr:unnamed protein product [Pelagomonas calceolata]